MPLYVYKCEACSEIVEIRRPVAKRDELVYHDGCNVGVLHRIRTTPGRVWAPTRNNQ